MKVNIYVDMDGVQAVYGDGDTVEKMSEVGYFRNRPVQKNVIDFIKKISADERFYVAIYLQYLMMIIRRKKKSSG